MRSVAVAGVALLAFVGVFADSPAPASGTRSQKLRNRTEEAVAVPTVPVFVQNWPTIQAIEGSVSVMNYPSEQTVVGTVDVGNLPLDDNGRVRVSNGDGRPKSIIIDTGGVALDRTTALGPFSVDGYDTVSVQLVVLSSPTPPPNTTCYVEVVPLWRNEMGLPFANAGDCSGGSCITPMNLSTYPYRYVTMVQYNVLGSELQLSVSPTCVEGTWQVRLALYLRRHG